MVAQLPQPLAGGWACLVCQREFAHSEILVEDVPGHGHRPLPPRDCDGECVFVRAFLRQAAPQVV